MVEFPVRHRITSTELILRLSFPPPAFLNAYFTRLTDGTLCSVTVVQFPPEPWYSLLRKGGTLWSGIRSGNDSQRIWVYGHRWQATGATLD